MRQYLQTQQQWEQHLDQYRKDRAQELVKESEERLQNERESRRERTSRIREQILQTEQPIHPLVEPGKTKRSGLSVENRSRNLWMGDGLDERLRLPYIQVADVEAHTDNSTNFVMGPKDHGSTTKERRGSSNQQRGKRLVAKSMQRSFGRLCCLHVMSRPMAQMPHRRQTTRSEQASPCSSLPLQPLPRPSSCSLSLQPCFEPSPLCSSCPLRPFGPKEMTERQTSASC